MEGGPRAGSNRVPLERFEVLRSSRFDEVLEGVSRALADHEMEVRHPGESLNARMNRVELGRCALDYLDLGTAVKVRTETLDDFYLFYTDLGDVTETQVSGKSFEVSGGTAALYSPSCFARLETGINTKHLHLTLPRAALESHLEALTGVPVHGPIIFEPQLRLTEGAGGVLRDVLSLLVRQLDADDYLLESPLVIANLEDTLMTALLTSHGHSHAARFDAAPAALVPRQVKRVEDYIHAHADQPITMRDLAVVAGVSARSIHHAFRRYRGYSPKALLKSVRLDRARERLLAADRGETVTGIAFDCGFEHLGRFSAGYAKRFGEPPSQTLARRQLVLVN